MILENLLKKTARRTNNGNSISPLPAAWASVTSRTKFLSLKAENLKLEI
jgi:hypothetical protein